VKDNKLMVKANFDIQCNCDDKKPTTTIQVVWQLVAFEMKQNDQPQQKNYGCYSTCHQLEL